MKEIRKPDMNLINTLANKIQEILENKFGLIYVRQQSVSVKEDNLEEDVNLTVTNLFLIEKENEPIYKKINSEDDLNKIKEEIKNWYKGTIDKFWELFEKVEDQLDKNIVDSLEIIGNTLQNREKKLVSAFKKFKVEDSWDIEQIQNEFARLLQKQLKDILESTMPSIHTGLHVNTIYEKVIKILNTFYGSLGIYTKEFAINDNISDVTEYIEIIQSPNNEIKDSSYKDKISYVETPTYLFEHEVIVLEAKVSVWRIS